jgi:RNA polymerase sigma-70 factor (ECF subfamily)
MPRAIEDIYWRHRQGLYTLALGITRRPQEAEDAVQTAFERLWRTSRRWRCDPTAYVFAAVRHAAIDQVRRRQVREAVPVSIFNGSGPGLRPGGPGPEASVLEAERDRLLREALEDLAQEDRETVILKTYADLTFDQMAQVLGEPLSTVASRYRRALEKLREKLEPCHGP